MENHIPLVHVYAMDHPALTPLASQANDRQAMAVIRGTAVDDQNIINAAVQCKRREVFKEVELATEDEVLQAKKREVKLLVDAALEGPIQQVILNAGLAEMQTTTLAEMERMRAEMERMKTEMERMKTEMERMRAEMERMNGNVTQIAIQTARNTNRSLQMNGNLVPVPDSRGVLPPDTFPRTIASISTMRMSDVESLLLFYNIPLAETNEVSRNLLADHIGIMT